MNPVNCRSSTVKHTLQDNINFAHPEPVYVYTDINKPNLVGDSYVRLLTSLHFPSAKGYHRFDNPLYKPVEQSYIESISIRLVMKTGENVLFEESDIPCLVILHCKMKSSEQQISVSQLQWIDIHLLLNQSGVGEIGPVYRASFRVQRGNGIGSFFRGLFRFVKPLLYSGAKAVGIEALERVSIV